MPYGTTRYPSDAANTGPYARQWDRGSTTGRADETFQSGSRLGAMFVATSGIITATATASLRMWRLTNPNASGKTIYVHRVRVQHWAVAAAATVITWDLAKTTDAPAAGTAITIEQTIEHGVTAVATVASLPTSGTQEAGKVASIGSEVAAAAPREYTMWDSQGFFDWPLQIDANKGLTIAATGTPDIDHRLVVQCLWEEA